MMKPLAPPRRLLMGPGPSEVAPEVLAAMSWPLLGHLDPAFLGIMDETAAGLREVFQTRNALTIALPGTGTSGMEAAMANLIEPGDRVVVGSCGYFGSRLAEVARRNGAGVIVVEGPWGRALDPEAIEKAIAGRRTKAVGVVHAETSTGVLQPIDPIARLARESGALLIVDAVTSLGGVAVEADRAGIDLCYSCSQKCLGAPPGLSPVTVSGRGMAAIRSRKSPVRSFYLDLTLLDGYWGSGRAYHHTAPISTFYALREALRLLLEEGLEARFRRHVEAHRALVAGIEAMGLKMLVPASERLPVLNTVLLPGGADEKAIRRRLLEEEGIEVGGGFGPLAGKILRIGLMGHGARLANVSRLIASLRKVLGG